MRVYNLKMLLTGDNLTVEKEKKGLNMEDERQSTCRRLEMMAGIEGLRQTSALDKQRFAK